MLHKHVLSPNLIGRTEELEGLRSLVNAALAGRGGMAVVGGDAGVGKTRLVRELKAYAAQQQMRVIEGRCSAAESAVPYGPFMDALRFRLSRGESGTAVQVLQPILAHVAPLFSQLAGTHTDEQPAYATAAPFEPIFTVLHRLTGLGPILFVFEDIHWADPTSRDLVHYIARRLHSLPMALVATCRTDDIHSSHPVHRLVASLERERLALRIQLDPLGRDETALLLSDVLGRTADAELVDVLFERTEGNPLFIEERLSAVAKAAAGSLAALDADELRRMRAPATLYEIVREWVSPLSPDAHEALVVASVIGRRFRFDVLAAVLEWPEARLVEVIEQLVELRIITEIDDAADESYAFRHSLLQEVIYDSTIGRRRRAWHRRVAIVLETVGGEESLPHTVLAHHYSKGGDLHDARVHTVLAGDEAARLCAWREAEAMYEDALSALKRAGGDPAVEADILERMAEVAWWQNRFDALEDYLRDALALRQQLGDPRCAAMLLRRLANLDAYQRDDTEHAFVRLNEALALLAGTESAERVFVLNDLGRLQLKRGDWAAAGRLFEESLAGSARLGDCAEEAFSLGMLGWLAIHDGSIAAGCSRLELARVLIHEQPVPVERATEVYHAGIRALEAAREHGRARAWLDAASAYARAHGTRADLAVYRAYEAAVDRRAGDWESARTAATEAVAELRTSGRAELREALRILGDVQRGRGDLDAARTSYDEALALGENDAAIGYALSLMAEERFDEAAQRLAAELDSQAGCDRLFALRVLPILVEASALAGDLTAARVALAELRALASQSDYRAGSAATAQASGVVHQVSGEPTAAVRELRRAASLWRQLDLPFEAARVTLLLSRQLIGARRRRQGLELATSALRDFEKMGAALEVARARHVLRRGGVRVRARRHRELLPAPLNRLTAREAEVLFELARGCTNKQIARTLSMSPRTVGNHVSSILAKLGCATRTEASRIALGYRQVPGGGPSTTSALATGRSPAASEGRLTIRPSATTVVEPPPSKLSA